MIETARSGLTYAVADLHGRHDLLVAALAAIDRHASQTTIGGSRTIVFLGDYVDRGPHSCAVLDWLVGGAPEGWHWICLKGNHEVMMSLALRHPERLDWWIDHGGDTTVASYRDNRDLVAAHLSWIEALPTIHVDTHRVYVHGGIDPTKSLSAQQDKVMLWKRYPRADGEGHGALHVVHGHDPNVDGPLLHAGRTNLDTYAWLSGRLVVGVFDDSCAGGPIDTIEVKLDPFRDGRSRAL